MKAHTVGGAAALFKYVQLPDPWQPSNLDTFTLRPQTSMEAMEELEEKLAQAAGTIKSRLGCCSRCQMPRSSCSAS